MRRMSGPSGSCSAAPTVSLQRPRRCWPPCSWASSTSTFDPGRTAPGAVEDRLRGLAVAAPHHRPARALEGPVVRRGDRVARLLEGRPGCAHREHLTVAPDRELGEDEVPVARQSGALQREGRVREELEAEGAEGIERRGEADREGVLGRALRGAGQDTSVVPVERAPGRGADLEVRGHAPAAARGVPLEARLVGLQLDGVPLEGAPPPRGRRRDGRAPPPARARGPRTPAGTVPPRPGTRPPARCPRRRRPARRTRERRRGRTCGRGTRRSRRWRRARPRRGCGPGRRCSARGTPWAGSRPRASRGSAGCTPRPPAAAAPPRGAGRRPAARR